MTPSHARLDFVAVFADKVNWTADQPLGRRQSQVPHWSIMTPDQLIEEGRRLARPCVHLKTTGSGEPSAIWHPRNEAELRRNGLRAWLTFDTSLLAGPVQAQEPSASGFEPIHGFLTVYSDEGNGEGGKLELEHEWPARIGQPLFAQAARPLPPLEVIFRYGSPAVGEWLSDNNWPRDKRYGGGFDDALIADVYHQHWLREQAMFTDPAVAAVVGGWHPLRTDSDWCELAEERLLVQTLHDAEPWIEAWQLRNGGFRVIRRAY